MQTENNNIEKAKFFAQYWGQEVLLNKETNTVYNMACIDARSDKWTLFLTPLSDINDEDAIEVANIIHAWVSNDYAAYYDIPGFVEYLKEVFTDGFGSIGISGISNYVKAYQYLQSKGYLLPWCDLSAEELIKRGWVRLKVK